MNRLYKTEVIEYLKADWRGLARCTIYDIKLGRYRLIKERVHRALGYVSPVDFEAIYYDKINPLGSGSLRLK